jgi:translation initiation factor IF-3
MTGRKIRINSEINAPSVSVIASDGRSLGVMATADALRMASEQGLALVEVDPAATPPACKILDFGNIKYQAAKQRVLAGRKPVEFEIRDNQFKEKT